MLPGSNGKHPLGAWALQVPSWLAPPHSPVSKDGSISFFTSHPWIRDGSTVHCSVSPSSLLLRRHRFTGAGIDRNRGPHAYNGPDSQRDSY